LQECYTVFMAIKNLVAQVVEARGMTRYKFWQETGLARVTAYRLVDDPFYVPDGKIWEKVCRTLDCPISELLISIPD
jgi:DNA-binding Xre family transcriptional regulator